jgi:hypothetical protein
MEDPPSLQPPHGFGSTSRYGAASGGWRMEKRCFLPDEPIHNNFYRFSQHCDPGTATTGFTARCGTFWHKSSQVPLHEALTHNIVLFWSNLVKLGQTNSRYYL